MLLWPHSIIASDQVEASLRTEMTVDRFTLPAVAEPIPKLKVALVHEWLYTYAGAEKVLEVMLSEFPDADVFSLIDRMPQQHRAGLKGKTIRTTFLQKIPFVQLIYRRLLPLMPFAIEQLDLSGYDIVISNSHAVAKGVITCARQLHICYCYTPMRYAWDLQEQYLKESGIAWGIRSVLARYFLHRIRLWDHSSAQHVDDFIACSAYIARRIQKVYRRDATVIYPNVDTNSFVIGGKREQFYFCSSRMVPYKKMHLIVEAFAKMPNRRLIMIGAGPQFKRIKKLATPNVTLLGYQPFPVLLDHLQRARAFIFAAEEDFGIAPLEAQACGTPVLAFGRGGAQETVINGRTGLHFYEQTAEAIIDVVERFEALGAEMDPETVRRHALRFSTERFRREFTDFVLTHWAQHAAEAAKTTLQPIRVQDRPVLSAATLAVGV
jgi:glycosyltransferase involved in cell wall biosynthesis